MAKSDKNIKQIQEQLQCIVSDLLNDIKQEDFKQLSVADKIQVITKLYPLINQNEEIKERKTIDEFFDMYEKKQNEIKKQQAKKGKTSNENVSKKKKSAPTIQNTPKKERKKKKVEKE